MRLLSTLILAPVIALLGGCSYGYAPPSAKPAPPATFVLPATPPAMAGASAQAALGKLLFEDKRLSGDGSTACVTCHQPDKGFADGQRTAIGIGAKALPRHTPALWNIGRAPRLMVDGRAASLEEQALMPMRNAAEMATDFPRMLATLQADPRVRGQLAKAFPGETAITPAIIARAIAAYERTLVSGPARFDRWARGDANAMSAAAVRGFALFAGRGGCSRCHQGAQFSDGGFHDIGLPDADRGRGAITGRRRDDHGFRTPMLREIGRSAPYMHDGSLPDLAAVVDHYADGAVQRRGVPARVTLSAAERRDLVTFLQSLDSEADPAT
jgi:cytochrome c peroxidase